MSTLLQREESKALIQIESSQLEFRRKRTGVNWVKWVNWLPSWRGDIEKSLDVYDFRIAPAPVTQKGSPNKETPLGTTLQSEEYVLAGDENLEGEFNTVKEPVPEWRELSDDETICKGDEKFVGRGPWLTQAMYTGEKAGKYPLIRFRTRRPLPKQEMPLGLASMMECFMGDYPDAGKAIYDAIYNLRDEIEALKKNQK
jgi:hypothetical protein